MVIGMGDLRKGLAVELDGEPYLVESYEQHKMQQRAPVTRVRFRDLRTGRLVERSFNGYDVKLNRASVETKTTQYLYNDGHLYYFMDTTSFEQYAMSEEQLGDALRFLKEEMGVELVFFREQPVTVNLPTFVELRVTATVPGIRGDTAQGGAKPATVETGFALQVPLFVNSGDVIRVDTRTGVYLERVG